MLIVTVPCRIFYLSEGRVPRIKYVYDADMSIFIHDNVAWMNVAMNYSSYVISFAIFDEFSQ